MSITGPIAIWKLSLSLCICDTGSAFAHEWRDANEHLSTRVVVTCKARGKSLRHYSSIISSWSGDIPKHVHKVRVRNPKSRKKKKACPARVAEAGQENIETVHEPKRIQATDILWGQGRRAMENPRSPQTQVDEGAYAIKVSMRLPVHNHTLFILSLSMHGPYHVSHPHSATNLWHAWSISVAGTDLLPWFRYSSMACSIKVTTIGHLSGVINGIACCLDYRVFESLRCRFKFMSKVTKEFLDTSQWNTLIL